MRRNWASSTSGRNSRNSSAPAWTKRKPVWEKKRALPPDSSAGAFSSMTTAPAPASLAAIAASSARAAAADHDDVAVGGWRHQLVSNASWSPHGVGAQRGNRDLGLRGVYHRAAFLRRPVGSIRATNQTLLVKILGAQFRPRIGQRALGHPEGDAHFGKADADRLGVEHLRAGRLGEIVGIDHVGDQRPHQAAG